MKVTVRLRRDRGRPRAPVGQKQAATVDLHLAHVTAAGRKVQTLQVLGADCPRLFEPRLVALSANVMRFVGFERDDGAWVMQEWECELL